MDLLTVRQTASRTVASSAKPSELASAHSMATATAHHLDSAKDPATELRSEMSTALLSEPSAPESALMSDLLTETSTEMLLDTKWALPSEPVMVLWLETAMDP